MTEATEVVLRLANTHDHGGRAPDRLADPAGVQDWLAAQSGSAGATVPVTAADAVELREIRDALLTLLLAHADAPGTTEDELDDAEGALRRARERYPLQAYITRSGAGLVPSQAGLAGVIGTALAAVVELAQSGTWARVKACRNCHHAFTDRSRNRSAGYCGTRCGTQAGMRAHRDRQRRAES